jgi:hypothetical protein
MRARALNCGLGLLQTWFGLVCGLGVWTAGLAQKPGPRGPKIYSLDIPVDREAPPDDPGLSGLVPGYYT